jgi:hypothetical protein
MTHAPKQPRDSRALLGSGNGIIPQPGAEPDPPPGGASEGGGPRDG